MTNTIVHRFVWFYAATQLKLKYRYTSLGFLWNFLEPALFLAVLSLVFSVVNKMNVADYAVFLFGALMPWRYFEKVVNTCMDSIAQGDWLLKKLYITPFALPITRWVVASVEFLISLTVVFVFFAAMKHSFSIHLLVLPLAILPWAILGLGIGLMCAVAFTFFRDVKTIVQMLLMLVFFSSPILFRPDAFPQGTFQARLVALHPFTYFAALFQKPIYHGVFPSATDWNVALMFALAALAIGVWLVNRYKNDFYFYL
jgi:ABC-type polysaccharide/polyol phosphate export permease